MRIGEICRRSVVTCRGDASALEVARLMREQHVGDVIVVDVRDGVAVPVGIVTDRDLVVQVTAEGLAAGAVRASELIVGDIVSVYESESVYDAIWHMRSRGVRRLPVVDAGNRLTAILAADDVIEFLAQELTAVARVVGRQIELERAGTHKAHEQERSSR